MTTAEETAVEAEEAIRKGIRLAALGRHAEAVNALAQGLAGAPGNPFAALHLGMELVAEGKGQEAKPHIAKALELKPTSAAFHLFAGRAFFDMDDFAAARAEFMRALELSPGNILAKAFISLTEWASGDSGAALKFDPADMPDSTQFLARLLMQIENEMHGKSVDVEDPNVKTPALDRPRVAYMLWRAEGARKAGKLDTAIGFVEMAMEMVPGHVGALDAMRECRKDAMSLAERKVVEEPEASQPRLALAVLLADAERFAEAEAAINEGIRLAEAHGEKDVVHAPEIERLQARIAFGLGRIDEALERARTGAEPGFSMSESHYLLGLCHLARGERRLCAEQFEKLVSKLWWALALRYREYRQWRQAASKSA